MIMANLRGTAGNDFLQGTVDSDALEGLEGNDTLNGASGNDSLQGGPNDDQLFGIFGRDFLTGGLGRDLLSGGGGSDLFRFADAVTVGGGVIYDTGVGPGTSQGVGRDRIQDFSRIAGDKIDLGPIDADRTTLVDDPFTFVGTAVPDKGELGFVRSGDDAIVRGNADDDPEADFEIELSGVDFALFASDFVGVL
jgi:Ca2+-binding RTX toxin-like protein